ncbi:MAG: penicillin-binding protein 1C [Sphingomonadales bacterium]
MRSSAALPLALLALVLALLLASRPAPVPDFAALSHQPLPAESQLLARDGRLLDARRTDNGPRRLAWVPLAAISPELTRRLVAAEDRRFWQHHGIDWRAVAGSVRAGLAGRGWRGASTISMQLAALIDPRIGAAGQRGPLAKLRQWRAARAIEARWTKPQILEAWANLLPFRADMQGVGAAAQGLAGKAPAALSPAESAILVALVRRPSARPDAVVRRACRTLPDAVCAEITAFAPQLLARRLPAAGTGLAPQLAARLLPDGPPRSLRTTIDLDVQKLATAALSAQLARLSPRNARDGAAIVVDNDTGEILAWVGAAGPSSTAPQVDGVTAPRQAGSTLKPYLYALALERRLLTAASILDDSPVDLDTANGLYVPQNYDRQFRGPVSVRSALGNSLNVPAVRALVLTGVDGFRDRLFDLGFRGLTRDGDYYGFSLALGSAEVTLLEQAAAMRALLRVGQVQDLRVLPGPAPPLRQLGEAAAFAIIRDIIADSAARTATFGEDNGLALPFAAAVKTGTSKAMRDNWCVGGSGRFTVAVWVGNFEGDPMLGVSGVTGAAPAWRAIMLALHRTPPAGFALPPGVQRRRVAFQPAVEPPRQELFLPGTWAPLFQLATPEQAAPRLLNPGDGTVLALDPDIPPARQRLTIRARGALSGLEIRVDGRSLGPAPVQLWAPVPGRHLVQLAAGPHVFDQARVSVR